MTNKINTKIKKADFREVSEKRCSDCNKFLKVNSVNKGYERCWVCDQVRNGKGDQAVRVKKKDNGRKVYGMSCKEKQAINRGLNKWVKR